jgi:hypothetical protein
VITGTTPNRITRTTTTAPADPTATGTTADMTADPCATGTTGRSRGTGGAAHGLPVRRALTVLSLAVALLMAPVGAGVAAAPAVSAARAHQAAPAASPSPIPSPSTSAQRQKLAKTRFAVNAGLAAGATYEWIVKPAKAGTFKKGAKGRTFAFVKAALAGTFAYNRLKAAEQNAKGDPTLSKLIAPLSGSIAALKALPSKLRSGQDTSGAVNSYNDTVNKVKEAGKKAGVDVKDQVPSTSQLTSGSGGS